MFFKTKILEIFTNLNLRYFKTNFLARKTTNVVQFHSGGDDYSPLLEFEGLGGTIGDNPANGFICGWRDDVTRKSEPGEKRLYSVKKDEDTQEILVAAEVHLKKDGSIIISGGKDLQITVLGNAVFDITGSAEVDAASLSLTADTIQSSGNWQHSGNFTASHIEAGDGASGTYTNSVQASAGIVTGGS